MLAQFRDADALVAAARRAHEAGYRHVETYTPFPIEGLSEILGFTHSRMPWVVLAGGIIGCIAGFTMQYWMIVVDYPINIGGRPLFSWPAFVPVTFETTVLCAALAAVLGMLALNGLPRPHHPLFGMKNFDRATQDRFFLSIRVSDPLFHIDTTRQFLEGLGPEEVIDVDV
jgi:hypothetical protein